MSHNMGHLKTATLRCKLKNGKEKEYEREREKDQQKLPKTFKKKKKMLPFNPQEVGILQQLEYTSFC